MPSKSKSQQKLFGIAYAVKDGKQDIDDLPDSLQDKVRSMVDNMSKKKLKKYAKTKHKGLPDKVDERIRVFKKFILNEAQKIKNKNK